MAEARKGKMKKDSEIAERVTKLRAELGNLTQDQLAERLGVGRAAVSQWESESREPTPEAYLKLGIVAKDSELRQWFWEQSGLNMQQLLLAAGEELKVDPGDVLAAALRKLADETRADLASALGKIPSNAELYVVDAEKARGGVFAEGDMFLLEPAAGPQALVPLWRKILLAEFPPQDKRPNHWMAQRWPEGLFIGRLLCERYIGDEKRLTYFATLGSLNDSETSWWHRDEAIPIDSWSHEGPSETPEEAAERERLTTEANKIHEDYQRLQSRYTAVPYSEFKKLPEAKRLTELSECFSLKLGQIERSPSKRAEEEAKQQAPKRLTVQEGVRIRGRVIAWFAAPSERR